MGPRGRSRGSVRSPPRGRETWREMVTRLPHWMAVIRVGPRQATLRLAREWRLAAQSLADAVALDPAFAVDVPPWTRRFEQMVGVEACVGVYPAYVLDHVVPRSVLPEDTRVGDSVPVDIDGRMLATDNVGWAQPTHMNAAGRLRWFYALRSYSLGLVVGDTQRTRLPIAVLGAAMFDDGRCRPLAPPPEDVVVEPPHFFWPATVAASEEENATLRRQLAAALSAAPLLRNPTDQRPLPASTAVEATTKRQPPLASAPTAEPTDRQRPSASMRAEGVASPLAVANAQLRAAKRLLDRIAPKDCQVPEGVPSQFLRLSPDS